MYKCDEQGYAEVHISQSFTAIISCVVKPNELVQTLERICHFDERYIVI